jgi:hypothetical protein
MRRELTCAVALASLLLLLAVGCAPARAVDYNVGLSVGNTATYSASITKANITSQAIVVAWTNVSALRLATTYHYANGTEKTRYDTWDVRYGPTGNLTLAFSFEWLKVVAANLNAGDNLWLAGDPAPINQSITMIVAGASRTVNLWQIEQDLFVYWDRATGLMVQLNMNLGPLLGWINYTMTTTNAWIGLPIPGYPLEAIGIAFILALLVGVLYRREHPKQP